MVDDLAFTLYPRLVVAKRYIYMFYKEQLEIITKFNIPNGHSKRANCPACGGKNTLSISKIDGKLIWYCFKAACDLKGRNNIGRTAEEVKLALLNKRKAIKSNAPSIPSILSNPDFNPEVVAYLKKNNSYEAWKKKLIRIGYCPASQRVCFFNPSERGCVGRSMSLKVKPKWKVYGDTSCELFTVGTCSSAVIVEDAASACAVGASGEYTGIALLGTNLSVRQKSLISSKYKNITIALDKDASKKALKLVSELRGRVTTHVKFLCKDLKTYDTTQIREILSCQK